MTDETPRSTGKAFPRDIDAGVQPEGVIRVPPPRPLPKEHSEKK
jgi:hypothetical protein